MRKQSQFLIFVSLLSVTACLAYVPAGHAAMTIDSAFSCTTHQDFHFDIIVTDEGDNDRVILHFGADNDVFSDPNERIVVNFSSDDGSILDQSPELQAFGSPEFDRWQDGPISELEMMKKNAATWRIRGRTSQNRKPIRGM